MPQSHARPATRAAAQAVLVVDDHADSAEALVELLRLEGFEAEAAASAEEALRRVAARAWDAVVLDVEMPGRSGVELARQWRAELQPPPRLIALSGHDVLLARLGGGSPFDAVLRKPVDIAQLLAALRPG